jgi:hypothetical protein
LNNYEIDEEIANTFDIEHLNIETIMLQAGYLTIKKIIKEFSFTTYILAFPNKEVEISFNTHISNMFLTGSKKTTNKRTLLRLLNKGDIKNIEPLIIQLFAGIAYNNFTQNEIANYEGFYASVIYAYFASLGLELKTEDVTNKGRIDLTLICGNRIFIFEFKVIDEEPLKQIKEKKYYEKYNGEIYIIGIVFNKENRNVTKFEWEQIS